MNKLVLLFLLSGLILRGAEQEEASPALPHFELVKSIPVPSPSHFKSKTLPIRFLKWHPNGIHVSCCDLGQFQISTLDSRTAACIKVIQEGAIMMDYNPHGDKLTSAAFDSKPKIWDHEYGALIRTLNQKHTRTAVWSRDGSCIACGGNVRTRGTDMNGVVKIWDPRSSEVIQAFVNPTIYRFLTHQEKAFNSTLYLNNQIISVDWSSDGSTIATGSKDGGAALWDVRTSKLLSHARLAPKNERPETVRFHPTKSKILKVGLSLIDTNELGMVLGELGHTDEWGFYQKGPDPKPKGIRKTLKNYDGSVMTWSFDGKLLGAVPGNFGNSEEKTLCLWDPDQDQQILESQVCLNTIDWHPSELAFIAGSHDGLLFLYKTQQSKQDTEEKEEVEEGPTRSSADIIKSAPEPNEKYNIKKHEGQCIIS